MGCMLHVRSPCACAHASLSACATARTRAATFSCSLAAAGCACAPRAASRASHLSGCHRSAAVRNARRNAARASVAPALASAAASAASRPPSLGGHGTLASVSAAGGAASNARHAASCRAQTAALRCEDASSAAASAADAACSRRAVLHAPHQRRPRGIYAQLRSKTAALHLRNAPLFVVLWRRLLRAPARLLALHSRADGVHLRRHCLAPRPDARDEAALEVRGRRDRRALSSSQRQHSRGVPFCAEVCKSALLPVQLVRLLRRLRRGARRVRPFGRPLRPRVACCNAEQRACTARARRW